jgi:membrane peptidoglycan carboxypeptidase
MNRLRAWWTEREGRLPPLLLLVLTRLLSLYRRGHLEAERLVRIAEPRIDEAGAHLRAAVEPRWQEVEQRVGRAADAVRPALERTAAALPRLGHARAGARDAASALGPIVRRAGSAVAPKVREAAPGAPPVFRQAGAEVRRGLGGAVPVVSSMVSAIQRELEAGREAKPVPRDLRDSRGRRLRASAYLFGPSGPRDPRRRRRGSRAELMPAALKVFLILLIGGGTFLGASSAYINFAADLPDAHQITTDPVPADTMIYASDGSLLADLHDPNQPHRYYQPLSQMGKWLPEATVAVEDANFWKEPGVDPVGIVRAAIDDLRAGAPVQGASTITQQLVKMRLTGDQLSIQRKLREAILAVEVQNTYTKRQILEQYLNTIYYGDDAEGALAASRMFFHENTSQLDLAQASMLAGLPQGPTYLDPFLHWDRAKGRQWQVLEAMVRNHLITQEEADQAYAEDIRPPDHMFLPGPDVVSDPAFTGWVETVLEQRYGVQTATEGGLVVHTTLDPQLQKIAQKAIEDEVAATRGDNVHDGAMVAIDPRTGAVLAMVGSANPDQPGGLYNMALQPLNTGSTFKVFTYSAAIASKKFTMVTPVLDSPTTIYLPYGQTYTPHNYDLRYHGVCQVQVCLGNSYNVPAVKIEMTVGVQNVVDLARAAGATPWLPIGNGNYSDSVPASDFGPSLTLGGYGVTVLEMANGVATLADMGVYHPAYGIQSIQSGNGSLIFQVDPTDQAKQVIDPRVTYILAQMLSNDRNREATFGAGSDLTLPNRKVAAKTGTADSFVDDWTVGYTPDIASAFWFGNPDSSPIRYGQDAIFIAAPAWHNFMLQATALIKEPTSDWYQEPPGLDHATVSGQEVWLLPGTSPYQPAPPLPSNVVSSSAPVNGKPGSANSGGGGGGGSPGPGGPGGGNGGPGGGGNGGPGTGGPPPRG